MAPTTLTFVLVMLLPAARSSSFVVKGSGLQAQEDGLKAAEEGRYNDALPLLRKALKGAPTSTVEDQQRIAIVRNALGGVLKSLGRFDEAAPLYEAAIAAFRDLAAGAKSHPSASLSRVRVLEYERAVVINNLGAVHAETDRREEARALEGAHAEAERLYTRALRIREGAFGAEHPAVAGSVNNLAVLLMDQRRTAEALPLLRRAAELARAQLGGKHPHYATALNNLGAAMEQHGLHDEARRHFKRALAINRKALGEEHASTRDTASNLGKVAAPSSERPDH